MSTPGKRSWAGAERAAAAVALLVAALLAAPARAQRPVPEVCPWCENDPQRLDAAGLVSHGPFPFAGKTTKEVQEHVSYARILWLESRHHRIGSLLEEYTVPERDVKFVRAELTELKEFFPKIDVRLRRIDPWLRLHLYALRSEKFYRTFLDLVGLEDDDFPDGTTPYLLGTGAKYMGEGRYLGEKEKFEIYLAETLAQYRDVVGGFFGLGTRKPQRWNLVQWDALWFGLWAQEPNLNSDMAVYCCLVHNLAHNYLDGFKHYSYDLPVWLTEGLGHWAQRQVHPAYVNYDTIEGSAPFKQNGEGWPAEVRRILQRGRAANLADLGRRHSFAELDQDDHLVVWSKIDFLIATDRSRFGRFLDRLKGRLDEEGLALSAGLVDEQRRALQEIYGWTLHGFEEAWKAYVLANYESK
jgi:hypothetical protein